MSDEAMTGSVVDCDRRPAPRRASGLWEAGDGDVAETALDEPEADPDAVEDGVHELEDVDRGETCTTEGLPQKIMDTTRAGPRLACEAELPDTSESESKSKSEKSLAAEDASSSEERYIS